MIFLHRPATKRNQADCLYKLRSSILYTGHLHQLGFYPKRVRNRHAPMSTAFFQEKHDDWQRAINLPQHRLHNLQQNCIWTAPPYRKWERECFCILKYQHPQNSLACNIRPLLLEI
ncbi:hypothetical protein D3C86_1154720 [compost metagenome]